MSRLHRRAFLSATALSALSPLARAFVLILLGVELEIEQALHVACGAAATASTPAAALSERHLDIAEGRLGAQQVLQSFLLRLERFLPLLGFQFVGCRAHLRRGFLHILREALELLVGASQLPARRALRQRFREDVFPAVRRWSVARGPVDFAGPQPLP